MEEDEKPLVAPHIKNKHTDDLVDHYWGSIQYISNLIKASELKAGLILSFYGILLNFIYQSLGTVLEHVDHHIGFYVLTGLWFASTIASVYYSIRCFIPRIEANYDKNIFFFGDVISSFGDIRQFSKLFYEISLDEERLFDQLGQQIYVNSKIAAIKFKNIHRALQFLAAGLVLLLVLTIYYSAVRYF